MPTFGENLRILRQSRGYTQEKFANIIDSTQSNVTAWERGTRMPSLQTIRGIADTFHVPLSSLISVGESGMDEDFVSEITDAIHREPKIRLLFDRAKYLTQDDLDVVIRVVSAIAKERGDDA